MLSIIFAPGCGSSGVTTYSCKGTVKLNGSPCNGALIVFHPLSPERINDPKPVATSNENGEFKLTTFELDDGALDGEYGVTIVWNVPDKAAKFSISGEGGGGSDKLQGRYGDPSNPKIKVEVKPQDENVFDFNLE